MTQVIENKEFNKYLQKTGPDRLPNVGLIFGDEFLSKSILDQIVNAILPKSDQKLNYQPLDGSQSENVMIALEHMNTFSMLAEKKVVALLDCQIFYSKMDKKKLIEKIRADYENDNMTRASRNFLALLSLFELAVSDIAPSTLPSILESELLSQVDEQVVRQLIDHCRENGLEVKLQPNLAQTLETEVQKGFPKDNYLFILTDTIDKRRSLFKTIKDKGVVVDCAVPKGERFADKKVQTKILTEKMQALLSEHRKQIVPEAVGQLFEMTGFDIRTFTNNLLKLINYVGDRALISVEDIHTVLKRTKKDPIYELTAAISEKNIDTALFMIQSLLDDEVHPLALLTAITNQIRKLLVAKAFLEKQGRGLWQRGISFDRFKNITLPAIIAYDKKLLEQLQKWSEHDLMQAHGKKKKAVSTDLVLAKNPNNAYPIFQTFLKSENFKINELIDLYHVLSEMDFRLKRTGINHRHLLEHIIFQICSPTPGN